MPSINIIFAFVIHLSATFGSGLCQNDSGLTKKFRLVLGIFSAIGTIFSLIFLFYFGFKTIWYYPLITLGFSIIIAPALTAIIQKIVNGLIFPILCILGVIVMPYLLLINL